MSSYRGAWDGGPPGAEAEYAAPSGAPPPLPATDPWTGARYAPYAAAYDYSAYPPQAPAPAPAYTSYGVDPAYYRAPDAAYYGKYPEQAATYPGGVGGGVPSVGYVPPRHERPARRSASRSASPYYARSPSPPARRRRRSASPPSARSRSRSHSRSSTPKRSRRRPSVSSDSSNSDESYERKTRGRVERSDRSSTPSPRPRPRSPSPPSSASRGGSGRSRRRDASTPPRKKRESFTPPKAKRTSRSPTTPRRPRRKEADRERSLTPPRSYKMKERRAEPPPRKARDSSVTPPKSYARSASSSSSKSESRGRRRRGASSRSRSSTGSRSRSRSSGSARSRSSRRNQKHRSRSRSKRRSRSGSGRGSGSRSHSHSSAGTPSDDEQRRGQFTVADRKRFWKMHKSRQTSGRTPPKETKPAPPPGALEVTTGDDIEYSDPPDLEGPNFAELLPAPDLGSLASSSRSRLGPLLAAPATVTSSVPLPLKNDGSFLEMFKKMQEQTKKAEEAEKKPEIKKPAYPFIGKRRGGRVLKTGLVKKAKAIEERSAEGTPKDAWSLYMQEVKKYRETSCEEERKTRPLVK